MDVDSGSIGCMEKFWQMGILSRYIVRASVCRAINYLDESTVNANNCKRVKKFDLKLMVCLYGSSREGQICGNEFRQRGH